MTFSIRAMCLIAGLGAIGACGDDDGGGGSSGVSGSKKASELTADEATKLCEYANGLEPDVTNEQICAASAAAATDDVATCEASIDDCVASLDMDDSEDDEDCSDAMDDVGGCDATVSAIEGCFKALKSSFEDKFTNTDCSDAGKVTQADLLELPSACDDVAQKCPDLLGGDDD